MGGGGVDMTDDTTHRYRLSRETPAIDASGTATWVMLNPSTADDQTDDPTIRRVVGFTGRWGYRRVEVVNVFAARATNPRTLKTMLDPIGGPEADQAIREAVADAQLVVAAWGGSVSVVSKASSRDVRMRHIWVIDLLRRSGRDVFCLGRTRDGYPRHPLYVPYRTTLERFSYV